MNAADPFTDLSRHRDPEPDPAIMQATIAQSVAAFRRRGAEEMSRGKEHGWLHALLRSGRGRASLGAGAFAVLAMVVIVPALLPAAPPDRLADAEAPAPLGAPSLQPGRGDGATTSMGLSPPPPAPSASRLREDETAVFDGDAIRVGSRLTPSALELFLPDIAGERAIGSQPLVPGEEAEVLAAFRLPERGVVAIRLRVDEERFWVAYRLVDGAYSRDATLTARIGDAPDDAEARRRLAAD